jgi:hypothetical protein
MLLTKTRILAASLLPSDALLLHRGHALSLSQNGFLVQRLAWTSSDPSTAAEVLSEMQVEIPIDHIVDFLVLGHSLILSSTTELYYWPNLTLEPFAVETVPLSLTHNDQFAAFIPIDADAVLILTQNSQLYLFSLDTMTVKPMNRSTSVFSRMSAFFNDPTQNSISNELMDYSLRQDNQWPR